MNLKRCVAILLLLLALPGFAPAEAAAKAAPFSFDTVWFYRDGIKVVPEISKRWLTVVFDGRYAPNSNNPAPPSDNDDTFIQKRARGMVKSHTTLVEYLYDPNLADNACFLRMRPGLKPEDVHRLIARLSQDGSVKYVHPAVILNNKTYAYFNSFEMEWKTGTAKAQREALLKGTHVSLDEQDEKGKRYLVDVSAVPFFKALNLLSEDIRVQRVTPHLVEIKPSISTKLSLMMGGGNIGDSIPFSLTIAFSDLVNIDPSSIATIALRPQEIQKELFDCTFDPYDYAKAATRSPIVITGRLRFFAPGEYSIPPVKISYSCPTGSSTSSNTVRSIETEPVLFKVSSIIPTDKSENRLIVPTEPLSHDFRLADLHRAALRYRWCTIGAFAGTGVCLLWLLLLWLKGAFRRDPKNGRKNPGELANRLRGMLEEPPTEPHWSYLGGLGNVLREYLVVLSGTDAKYVGGSGRRFMETVGERLHEECVTPLGSIFAAIDDSVAVEAEQVADIDELQSEILRVIDLTARRNGKR